MDGRARIGVRARTQHALPGATVSSTDYANVSGAAVRLKKTGSTITPEYAHFDHLGSAIAASAKPIPVRR